MENYINEIWKKIDGYNDYYEVSNFGRIRNIKTKRVLKPSVAKRSGYNHINLQQRGAKNGYITVQVHRIVGELFITKVVGKNIINHKNFNKTDNRAENLEWCNQSENVIHSLKIKRRKMRDRAKVLDIDTVRAIRKLLKLGHSQSKIAKFFKINRNIVLNISQNKTYKNVA